MNTQKEVFNKLFKEDIIEFSTQKVELSLIQDIEKRDKFIKKTLSEMDGLEADFLFTKKRIKNIANLLESDADLLDKDVSKAISKLKDLGIDSKEFSQYAKTISKAKQESKKIKSIIN